MVVATDLQAKLFFGMRCFLPDPEVVCGNNGHCVGRGCVCDFWTEGQRCEHYSWPVWLFISLAILLTVTVLVWAAMYGVRSYKSHRQVRVKSESATRGSYDSNGGLGPVPLPQHEEESIHPFA
ncbi:hypothetical protein FOZ63_027252 [Perkinsus olseni]|uniref:Uncharacterized protein n=2 Tax=Perkinsus olseni TaxID=32597 RepID=A0A7J6U961_PEROL|nr:hypothetical protein FOZ63_027252 [Perkinsus olseni]